MLKTTPFFGSRDGRLNNLPQWSFGGSTLFGGIAPLRFSAYLWRRPRSPLRPLRARNPFVLSLVAVAGMNIDQVLAILRPRPPPWDNLPVPRGQDASLLRLLMYVLAGRNTQAQVAREDIRAVPLWRGFNRPLIHPRQRKPTRSLKEARQWLRVLSTQSWAPNAILLGDQRPARDPKLMLSWLSAFGEDCATTTYSLDTIHILLTKVRLLEQSDQIPVQQVQSVNTVGLVDAALISDWEATLRIWTANLGLQKRGTEHEASPLTSVTGCIGMAEDSASDGSTTDIATWTAYHLDLPSQTATLYAWEQVGQASPEARQVSTLRPRTAKTLY